MPAKDIKNMADHLNFVSEDLEEETISRMVSRPVPASGKNRITCLTPEQLVEYTDEEFQTATGRPQPFHEYDGEEFKSLVESVKENGILEPVIVRPFHGKYQILAGRHRTRAAKIAGKPILCLIREDADDIEAAKIMLDTNLEQRPQPKYSELAYAYRMQAELNKNQGQRTDLNTLSNGCTKLDTAGEIGKKDGKSRSTVYNYIQLSNLIPELLQKVDDKKIDMTAGIELSHLSPESQKQILAILPEHGKIKKNKALELCKAAEEQQLTTEKIRAIFDQPPVKKPVNAFRIDTKRLEPYRDILPNQKVLEDLFFEFLDQLKTNMQPIP